MDQIWIFLHYDMHALYKVTDKKPHRNCRQIEQNSSKNILNIWKLIQMKMYISFVRCKTDVQRYISHSVLHNYYL